MKIHGTSIDLDGWENSDIPEDIVVTVDDMGNPMRTRRFSDEET